MTDLEIPTVDPAEVRLEAERILDRPEFRDDRDFVERGLDWLGEQLGRLVPDGAPGGGGLSSLVSIFLVVVAAWLLVVGGRALLRLRRQRGAAGTGPGLTVVLGEAFDPSELERSLAAAEASGDWRLALLARYRLMVATLIERRVLTDQPGRTTGEYRAEIRDTGPERADEFAAATSAFERAYYGAADVGPDEVALIRELNERIVGLAGTRR